MLRIKQALVFFAFFSFAADAQTEQPVLRQSAAMQFGGQTIVSFHHEYALIARPHIQVRTNLGIGLNEFSDDATPPTPAIYGIHSGFIVLAGIKPLFLDLGLHPTTYFFGSTTFINLNGWIGLRATTVHKPGIFMSAGYTPVLYTSYSNPGGNLLDIWLGVKIGAVF